MAKPIRVENISLDPPQELGILRSEKVPVGRESTYGFCVESPTVSRQHGIFIPYRNYWFFKDLGSTNGSWVNGVKLTEEVLHLVRPNDHIQLADSVLRLSALSQEAKGNDFYPEQKIWSLIVFMKEELRDEFPIPKLGKALIVGGKEGDFQLSDDQLSKSSEDPSVVFERRKDGVYVFQVDRTRAALLNGQRIQRSVKLNDNDIVQVEDFSILFNCPPSENSKALKQEVKQSMDCSGSKEVQDMQSPFVVPGEGGIKSWGQGGFSHSASQQNDPSGARGIVSPSFGWKAQGSDGPLDTIASGAFNEESLNIATRAYNKGPIKREAYRPRVQRYDEEESHSLYQVLIYVFSALCLCLIIVVAALFLR